jgi:hypothetical protein
MLSPQREAELPWEQQKEAMEMAKIPVIPVVEDEHIFHERPPPEPVDELPPEEPPPEEEVAHYEPAPEPEPPPPVEEEENIRPERF